MADRANLRQIILLNQGISAPVTSPLNDRIHCRIVKAEFSS